MSNTQSQYFTLVGIHDRTVHYEQQMPQTEADRLNARFRQQGRGVRWLKGREADHLERNREDR